MTWSIMFAIGACTFALRASFLVWLGGRSMPRLEHYLRFVPVAVLPVIALSATIGHGPAGTLDVRVAAAVAGAVVAWRTRSVAATMAVGMVVLWLLQAWTRA